MRTSSLFIVIALLSSGTQALADVYQYAAARLTCSVSATREAIGVKRTTVGAYETLVSVLLFRSQVYHPRLTAFNAGELWESDTMLETGGIPSPMGTKNWSVLENVTAFKHVVALPGFELPLEFEIVNQDVPEEVPAHLPNARPQVWRLDFLSLKGGGSLSFAQARDILVRLGDVETPNFVSDPPAMNANLVRLDARSYAFSWQLSPEGLHYHENVYPFPRRAKSGYANGRGAETVIQLHYPAERHNGRSYHIHIGCQPGPVRR